eukprot:CAMPEP_0182818944 /NCGR_PEP_ID=MMETSP0006_2-20121128/12306_1 /TAXON_ID=97485 /ORGANISM="Prymnesium parvum, Strain Texoma1" /LENGTH=537 /DNA_ID=CAMNT_0024945467 /DNA_START=396 /DNA_END=2009 /DNA_ORIENTATION=+
MSFSIVELKEAITKVEESIAKLQTEINALQTEINALQPQITEATEKALKSGDDKEYWREEKQTLRNKEQTLRNKDNHLCERLTELEKQKGHLLAQSAGGSQDAAVLFGLRLTLERDKQAKGLRRSLFEWGTRTGACFHPDQQEGDFAVSDCPMEPDSRLLEINLVFEDKLSRTTFLAEVSTMLCLGWDNVFVRAWPRASAANPKSIRHALNEFEIPSPTTPLRKVFINDYICRADDASPPEDSPNPDEHTESDRTSHRPVPILPDDQLFKRARIEKGDAFRGERYEKAHIIPLAACGGSSRSKSHSKEPTGISDLFWLSTLEDNYLPLSQALHTSFDGTGGGRGNTPETQARIALQPLSPTNERDDRGIRIPVRAWFRFERDALDFQRWSEDPVTVTQVPVGSSLLYAAHGNGVATYGSPAERVIPTAPIEGHEVVGAIPLWPTSISRTEALDMEFKPFKTLSGDKMAGWEIMWCCLRWNFHSKICGEWRVVVPDEDNNSSDGASRLSAANKLDEQMNEAFAEACKDTAPSTASTKG